MTTDPRRLIAEKLPELRTTFMDDDGCQQIGFNYTTEEAIEAMKLKGWRWVGETIVDENGVNTGDYGCVFYHYHGRNPIDTASGEGPTLAAAVTAACLKALGIEAGA